MSRVVMAILAALLLVGCGAQSSRPPAVQPSGAGSVTAAPQTTASRRVAALQTLLDHRAEAVRSGRKGAFDATVAGTRPAQDHLYAELRALPLGTYTLRLGMPDLAASRGRTYVATVEETTELASVEEGGIEVDHAYTFRRTSTGWRVVSDVPDRSRISAAPWEAPGATTTTRGGLVLVTQGLDHAAESRAERLAYTALVADQGVLPIGTLAGAVVMLFRNDAALRTEDVSADELGLLGGLTVAEVTPDPDLTVTRVIVAPVMLTRDDGDLVHVIRHELVHVALAGYGGQPTWLSEGAAEYYAWKHTRAYLNWDAVDAAYAGRMRHLPQDATFHLNGAASWNINYGLSWWAVQALAADHVDPIALMRKIKAKAAWREADVSALLAQDYGLTVDGLARQAGRLIRRHFAPR